jgi:hypothetical protein
MVVTISDGKITELKGCAGRASAVAYAQTGEAADSPTAEVRAPETTTEPSEQRVGRLVPFVNVADVERSVAFYLHLGFTPKSMFKYRDLLAWAARESDGAGVMFQRSDPSTQRAKACCSTSTRTTSRRYALSFLPPASQPARLRKEAPARVRRCA